MHLRLCFQITPLLLGIEGLVGFLDLFVPLTGRMGAEAPADFIIASLVTGIGFLCVPMVSAEKSNSKSPLTSFPCTITDPDTSVLPSLWRHPNLPNCIVPHLCHCGDAGMVHTSRLECIRLEASKTPHLTPHGKHHPRSSDLRASRWLSGWGSVL